jgi:hypothetical protein
MDVDRGRRLAYHSAPAAGRRGAHQGGRDMGIANTLGIYLRQSAASRSDRPAETLPAQPTPSEQWQPSPREAPVSPGPVPVAAPAGTADRIVDYLRSKGPTPTVSIVQDLGLTLDDAMLALERLESFGFVTVDRAEGKATVALPG